MVPYKEDVAWTVEQKMPEAESPRGHLWHPCSGPSAGAWPVDSQ